MKTVPFTHPYISTRTHELIDACLASGHLAGDGPFSVQAASLLQRRLGVAHALLTPSCTHALELACALVGGRQGDEIIVPSFTFTSTASAVVQQGFVPVFADIDPSTMNIDPEDVRRCITARTRAVIVVHYAGVACDMDALAAICTEHGLTLIEDAAHALGGAYRNRPLGSIGAMSAFSFHATKNITCGEGGAFVTNDASLAHRAEIYREKGTNRTQFMRGDVDRYTWVDKGSSLLLAEPLAAMLTGGLQDLDRVQQQRSALVAQYRQRLQDARFSDVLTVPAIPPESTPAYHLQHVLMRSEAHRDAAIAALQAHGIRSAFHYIPLHTSPMGRRLHAVVRPLLATEDAAPRLLRLPLHTAMTTDDVDHVVDVLEQWSTA